LKPWQTAAFLMAGVGATILALYAAFVAIGSFFLVPDNTYISPARNWVERIGMSAAAIAIAIALAALAKFCFTKRKKLRRQYPIDNGS
jgi:hypothetical protein